MSSTTSNHDPELETDNSTMRITLRQRNATMPNVTKWAKKGRRKKLTMYLANPYRTSPAEEKVNNAMLQSIESMHDGSSHPATAAENSSSHPDIATGNSSSHPVIATENSSSQPDIATEKGFPHPDVAAEKSKPENVSVDNDQKPPKELLGTKPNSFLCHDAAGHHYVKESSALNQSNHGGERQMSIQKENLRPIKRVRKHSVSRVPVKSNLRQNKMKDYRNAPWQDRPVVDTDLRSYVGFPEAHMTSSVNHVGPGSQELLTPNERSYRKINQANVVQVSSELNIGTTKVLRADQDNCPCGITEDSQSESGPEMKRYPKRCVAKKNYYEPEEPHSDNYIWCDDCHKEWLNECPIHGPLTSIHDTPVTLDSTDPLRAEKTVPSMLSISSSKIPGAGLGVWSNCLLESRVCFGPYEGVKLNSQAKTLYNWELRSKSKWGPKSVDASNPGLSNWMRYVNCARNVQERNLLAYQYKEEIYYRTYKLIPPDTELLVSYGEDFNKLLGINKQDFRSNKDLPAHTYPCPNCNYNYSGPLNLKKHVARCLNSTSKQEKCERYICPHCSQCYSAHVYLDKHYTKCRARKKQRVVLKPAGQQKPCVTSSAAVSALHYEPVL